LAQIWLILPHSANAYLELQDLEDALRARACRGVRPGAASAGAPQGLKVRNIPLHQGTPGLLAGYL